MATAVEEARITGVKPALRIDRLAGRLVVLEIAPEHAAATYQHLAAIADLDFDTRARPARAVGVRLVVRLERRQSRELSGTVDLLEVDTQRAEKTKCVHPEWPPARVTPARAAQPELIAHRPVHQRLAKRAGEPQARRHWLTFTAQDLGLSRC